MKKRLMSFFLCFAMLAAMLPMSVQAVAPAGADAPEIPTEGDVWDGSITEPTKLVKKDEVYYYEITKCSELAYVAQTGGDWLGYNYILANNLILNDVTLTWDEEGNCTNDEELLEWTPIGSAPSHPGLDYPFRGIFEGNGYCISGLYLCNPNENHQGFIGTNKGAVRNLHIVNSHVEGQDYVGGIVGYGYEVSNCSFFGSVIGRDIVGGISGICSRSVEYCTANGFVKGSSLIGGIIGRHDGKLSFCINNASIMSSGNYTGGIVGCSGSGYINNSINKGNVVGAYDVGGIAGIGGQIALLQFSMNTGSVRGLDRIGGIAGTTSGGDIDSCFNSGTILGTSHAGGIVGCMDENSYDDSATRNCYNIASVSSTEFVGGVCGEIIAGTVSSCYSIGSISGETSVGGIAGSFNIWETITLANNYYLAKNQLWGCGNLQENSVDQYESKTATELKKQGTYKKWNFDSVWSISSDKNDGYPYLQWQEDMLSEIPVGGVSISETSLSLAEGDFAYLTAIVSPANASNKSVTWSSSDSGIATVTTAGKVTAVSPGTATITATTKDGGYTATCTVTVTERLVEEYRINSITVRDDDGAVLSEIPVGNFLATVSITNVASEGNTLVFLASYTAEGQYQGMMWVSVEDLPIGATIKITLPVDNSDEKIANLTAFVVASFSNLTPLGGAVSFLP